MSLRFRGGGCANAALRLWGRANERGGAQGFLLRSRKSPENGHMGVLGSYRHFRPYPGKNGALSGRIPDDLGWMNTEAWGKSVRSKKSRPPVLPGEDHIRPATLAGQAADLGRRPGRQN